MISERERRLIGDGLKGRFYGPCSGRDLPIAFELFGDTVDWFTFCDLAYKGPQITAQRAVPNDWKLISRIRGTDEAVSEKMTWYSGNRSFRPRAAIENWRRPDGSDVIVELRCDLAQDVLLKHFSLGSISVFMHINDGTGEGGSNLWFLGSHDEPANGTDLENRLLPELACRLANGAVVLTDAQLADTGFRSDASFKLEKRFWEYICSLPNVMNADRDLRLWHVHDANSV